MSCHVLSRRSSTGPVAADLARPRRAEVVAVVVVRSSFVIVAKRHTPDAPRHRRPTSPSANAPKPVDVIRVRFSKRKPRAIRARRREEREIIYITHARARAHTHTRARTHATHATRARARAITRTAVASIGHFEGARAGRARPLLRATDPARSENNTRHRDTAPPPARGPRHDPERRAGGRRRVSVTLAHSGGGRDVRGGFNRLLGSESSGGRRAARDDDATTDATTTDATRHSLALSVPSTQKTEDEKATPQVTVRTSRVGRNEPRGTARSAAKRDRATTN